MKYCANRLRYGACKLSVRKVVYFIFALFGSSAIADTTMLINANIIDLQNDTVIENATVLIADGMIESISQDPLESEPGTEIIDIEEMYLLPGYIDAHVHIDSLAGAARALDRGVTTARSASTRHFEDAGLNALFHAGGIPGPEIVPAGTLIERSPGESLLGDVRFAGFHGGVVTDDDLRQFVQINVERGAQWIKTRNTASPMPYFSDDSDSADIRDLRQMVMSQDDVEIIVAEARQHQKPVMIHSYGDPAVLQAVNAGVKSVEHGSFASASTLQIMKNRDVFLVPTLLVFRDATEPHGELITTRFDHHLGPMIQPGVLEMWRDAYEIGVKMVLSTDSSYTATSKSRIGAGITEYVRLGMTPFEALRAATELTAELLGIGHRTGRIAEGYEADIIAVYGDPTNHPEAFQDIVFVMSNGTVVRNNLPFKIE